MVRVSKKVFQEMLEMGLLNHLKDRGFITCNRQHCRAKTHYVQDNLYQKYLDNIKMIQSTIVHVP